MLPISFLYWYRFHFQINSWKLQNNPNHNSQGFGIDTALVWVLHCSYYCACVQVEGSLEVFVLFVWFFFPDQAVEVVEVGCFSVCLKIHKNERVDEKIRQFCIDTVQKKVKDSLVQKRWRQGLWIAPNCCARSAQKCTVAQHFSHATCHQSFRITLYDVVNKLT